MIGLVIEYMRKMSSVRAGRPVAEVCLAVGLEMHDLAVTRDERDNARRAAGSHGTRESTYSSARDARSTAPRPPAWQRGRSFEVMNVDPAVISKAATTIAPRSGQSEHTSLLVGSAE